MENFLSDTPHIDEETGQDSRPFQAQANDLMSDWDAMLGDLTAPAKPAEAAEVD